MKYLVGHDKDFGIYSVCSGKVLEGVLQGRQWYDLIFLNTLDVVGNEGGECTYQNIKCGLKK